MFIPKSLGLKFLRDYQIVQTDSHLSNQVRVKGVFLTTKNPLTIFWQISETMIGDIWIDRETVSSFTVRDVIQNFRHLPMTAEIRSRFQHCNMIYIPISHLIEEWTGIWLGDCFRTQIHELLSMVDTFFSLSDAQEAIASGGRSLVTPYYRTQRYHGILRLDSSQLFGCGATLSDIIDYSK